MSDEAWKAVAQTATLLGVLISLFNSIRNGRRAKEIAAKVEVIRQDVNGKSEQLLAAVGAKERAVGMAEGRRAGIVERADRVAEEERVADREADKKRE